MTPVISFSSYLVWLVALPCINIFLKKLHYHSQQQMFAVGLWKWCTSHDTAEKTVQFVLQWQHILLQCSLTYIPWRLWGSAFLRGLYRVFSYKCLFWIPLQHATLIAAVFQVPDGKGINFIPSRQLTMGKHKALQPAVKCMHGQQ